MEFYLPKTSLIYIISITISLSFNTNVTGSCFLFENDFVCGITFKSPPSGEILVWMTSSLNDLFYTC